MNLESETEIIKHVEFTRLYNFLGLRTFFGESDLLGALTRRFSDSYSSFGFR